MATINTNMSAQIASNSMTRNERTMSSTMERLSTGLRINSAKDDAAGLAISSKMTSQLRGLNQAVRNANDAISMIQVAEGAMKEVTNMFQRMRELAVQAISDSNTSSDRTALNNEYKQLSAEVKRIAENTQWNGTNILDGARTSTTFQIGANASQTIDVNFGDLGNNSVVPVAAAASGAVVTTGAITAADSKAVSIEVGNNKGVVAEIASGDTMAQVAAKITGANSGSAVAAEFGYVLADDGLATKTALTDKMTVSFGGQSVDIVLGDGNDDKYATLGVLVADSAVQTALAGIGLSLSEGADVDGDTTASTQLGLIFTADSAGFISSSNVPTVTITGVSDAAVVTKTTGSDTFASLGISSIEAASTGTGLQINYAAASGGSGSTATGFPVVKVADFGAAKVNGANSATITPTVVTEGVPAAATQAATSSTGARADISFTGAVSAGDIVTAKVTDSAGNSKYASFELSTAAATAVNSTVSHTADASGGNDSATTATIVESNNTGFDAGTLTGSIVNGKLRISGATQTAGKTFTLSDIEVSRGTHAPVGGSDITSSTSANTALSVLDTAINNINSTRAGLGASMSRLEYASDNLQNVAQNTGAARSRILDADYAAETTELARTQIIQQAATAMLAQANQSQQAVLALLR